MHRVRMLRGAMGGRRRVVRVASVPRPVLRTGCRALLREIKAAHIRHEMGAEGSADGKT